MSFCIVPVRSLLDAMEGSTAFEDPSSMEDIGVCDGVRLCVT
jgi:hypothetical protein